jgi:LPPG:FO 2-phospho-L-lactate transferase
VQTQVRTEGEWRHFQEYLIRQQSGPAIEDVEFRGVENARISPEVAHAIDTSELIVIGPSNPVASIGPILAVPGISDALHAAGAPVVVVSPFVGGRSLKGPTEQFMEWAGLEVSDAGIANRYAGLATGLIVDRDSPTGRATTSGMVLHQTETLMADARGRARLAQETLEFGQSLTE